MTDNGIPPLSGTASFTITVHARPSLGSVSIAGGAFSMTWSAIPDMPYRIEYKTNLNQSGWLLSGNVIASGNAASFTDATELQAERYYRVVAAP